MQTSITISLDSHKKADGTYPVVLRITHFQKIAQINLGASIKAEDWDDAKRKVKGTYKGTQSVTRLNTFFDKKKTEANDKLRKLDDAGRLHSMTVVEVKKHLEGKKGTESFFQYAEELITGMKNAQQIGNARTYEFTVSVLRGFVHERDLSFREITYDFLVSFEQYHLGKGRALNGLSVYMRTIRAVFNKAIKSGLIDADLYPFKRYSIKGSKTRKRAIKTPALQQIEALEYEAGNLLFNARNYFLISFYFGGMSFVDMAHLKFSSLKAERLEYTRQKSGAPLSFDIIPEARAILDYYCAGKKDDDFIFPIITATNPAKQYNQVMDKRRRYNKKLKLIAKECGIAENLTSYVSRHSFATRANNMGVPVENISEFLGHSDTKTTKIYLDSLPSDVQDSYHKQIARLK